VVGDQFIGWVCVHCIRLSTSILSAVSDLSLCNLWRFISLHLPEFDMGTLMPVLMGMLGLGGLRTFEKGKRNFQMKKNFDHCLDMLLEHEGGFVNHPKDPGGMTNLGVTRATYEQYMGRGVTEAEMRALTVADVAPIYRAEYWDKARCDDLPSGLDWAVFDWGVNSGMSQSG
jgi:hypothetical protein